MPSDELQEAIAHHRAGRLAEAEALYRQILATEPRNADAWHLLGVAACQRGDFARAREQIERAISIVPDNAEFHINLGEALRRANAWDAAIRAFGRAAELQPESVYPWYNLGVVLALSGRKDEAINVYKIATECAPTLAEAHNNLGVLLYERGDATRAAQHYRQAIALLPTHAEAHNNLGLALWQTHVHAEALAAFARAAELKPGFAAAHMNAAAGYRRLGMQEQAAAAFGRAAALDPESSAVQRDYGLFLMDAGDRDAAAEACRRAVTLARNVSDAAAAHHALGAVLSRIPGQEAHAVAAYEEALALQPQSEAWRFELAGLRGEPVRNAPDTFVKTLFDGYAWKFEKHLVEELHYHVPEDLLEATLACTQADRTLRQPPWDILDLGCGTGRCGALFKPHAKSIVGIDLAPNMIESARRRGVYTSLEEGHIVPAMARRDAAVDLILAGDVFIYVGALEAVFAAARTALRKGGMLAFSLEHHAGEGFVLHRQHRFAHSPAYIRTLAAREGFTEKLFRQAVLRDDAPAGWIVVLAR